MNPIYARPLFMAAKELGNLVKTGSQNLTVVNFNYNADKWDHIYQNERIPFARYLNLGKLSDSRYKTMLPSESRLAEVLEENDIGINDHVVCYSDDNFLGSCRGYWMMRMFGFQNIQIMNGLTPYYKELGFDVETSSVPAWKNNLRARTSEDFKLTYNTKGVKTMAEMREIVRNKTYTLIDGRPHLMHINGAMPWAKNIPYTEFLDPVTGRFKSKFEIERIFDSHKLREPATMKYVMSCLNGMAASIELVAAMSIGAQEVALYDGSYEEWSDLANENEIRDQVHEQNFNLQAP